MREVQQGEACVCDKGFVERDGDCVRAPPEPRAPTPDEDEASTNDAGASMRDASPPSHAGGAPAGPSATGPGTDAPAESGERDDATDTPRRGTTAGSPPVVVQPPPPPARPGETRPSDPEYCDDGNLDPNDACVGHVKARCGDGRLHVGVEECEIGLGGWTAESCKNCVRTRYTECSSAGSAGCPNGRVVLADGTIQNDHCWRGVCTPYGCSPLSPDCKAPCPTLPGSLLPIDNGSFCMLPCLDEGDCPKGLVCDAKMAVCMSPDYLLFPENQR